MTDGAPAPLTPAERVALSISAQALQSTAARLRAEWCVFELEFPERTADGTMRGYLMAVRRLESMADNMKEVT